MAYTSKQSAPESIAEHSNKITTPSFSDQRASTYMQLKQQGMMHAHSKNIIHQLNAEESEPLQGEFETEAPAQLQEAPAEAPNNTGLPNQLKSGIESLSGMSMDNVKVHYNSDKPAQLNAHAYAQGTDIHVAPGQEQHLPHEAWHVVQQAQGRVKPTMQMKAGVPINDDTGLENEADVMGQKALSEGQNEEITQKVSINSSNSTNTPMQFVLTRSMQKIIDETVFRSDADYVATKDWLLTKYSEDIVSIIIGGIVDRQNDQPLKDNFKELTASSSGEVNDQDEVEINVVDHGDLQEYDHPESIDKYLSQMQITQLARKGNTVSGPKNYNTSGGAAFNQVSYQTDGKGCIDFTNPYAQAAWSNPVLAGSEVDLTNANKPIDTKNRAQHFAIGDYLYAQAKGLGKASATTNMRKGKWTWHHLPSPYKMVLVDMTVHAKHGHNGGVYLW